MAHSFTFSTNDQRWLTVLNGAALPIALAREVFTSVDATGSVFIVKPDSQACAWFVRFLPPEGRVFTESFKPRSLSLIRVSARIVLDRISHGRFDIFAFNRISPSSIIWYKLSGARQYALLEDGVGLEYFLDLWSESKIPLNWTGCALSGRLSSAVRRALNSFVKVERLVVVNSTKLPKKYRQLTSVAVKITADQTVNSHVFELIRVNPHDLVSLPALNIYVDTNTRRYLSTAEQVTRLRNVFDAIRGKHPVAVLLFWPHPGGYLVATDPNVFSIDPSGIPVENALISLSGVFDLTVFYAPGSAAVNGPSVAPEAHHVLIVENSFAQLARSSQPAQMVLASHPTIDVLAL